LKDPSPQCTGIRRGRISLPQRANTQFQAEAALGGLWSAFCLIKSGFRLVGFVHDEFLVELERGRDLEMQAEEVKRIVCEGMQRFIPDIPVEAEYVIGDCWTKAIDRNERSKSGKLIPYRRDRGWKNENATRNGYKQETLKSFVLFGEVDNFADLET
jgi:hypothetical protein